MAEYISCAIRTLRSPMTDTSTKRTRKTAAGAFEARSKTGGSKFSINLDREFNAAPKFSKTSCASISNHEKSRQINTKKKTK
jgi:hypothetical protein